MTMTRTVEVLGVDLVVEFDGTPFVPAYTSGPPEDCYPASGGEADILVVWLDGNEVTPLLNDWTLCKINEQLVAYLCSGQVEEAHEPA